jgi:putative sigma-54 modulation protein
MIVHYNKELRMQITLSGHHIEITEALKKYVNDKFSKLAHHSDEIISIKVILLLENIRQVAEASIHIKGSDLFAKADSEDMYAAIDLLVDKLDRQLINHKTKVLDRQQHARRTAL